MDTLLASADFTGVRVTAILPILLLTTALAFVMNAVALPLPPTWVGLAAIYGTTQVPLLPLTLGGTIGAMLGRGGFALSIRSFDTAAALTVRFVVVAPDTAHPIGAGVLG